MQLSASWPEMKFERSRPRGRPGLQPGGEAPREEGVDAAAHKAGPTRSFCARMYTAMMVEKTTSMTPADDGGADVGRGAEDVSRRADKAVHALGERVAYVGEDLIPVYVAEVGGEGEVKGLEHRSPRR